MSDRRGNNLRDLHHQISHRNEIGPRLLEIVDLDPCDDGLNQVRNIVQRLTELSEVLLVDRSDEAGSHLVLQLVGEVVPLGLQRVRTHGIAAQVVEIDDGFTKQLGATTSNLGLALQQYEQAVVLTDLKRQRHSPAEARSQPSMASPTNSKRLYHCSALGVWRSF